METIKNLTVRLNKITRDFSDSFGNLTQDQLNLKPDPKKWSIAQIIDHLIRTNESYYPIIEQIRKGEYKPPFISRIDFLVNFLGRLILKGVESGRKRKVKTFPIWEPVISDLPEGILKRFRKHQQDLEEFFKTSADLLDNRTIISSPANRNIVYTLETAFDIIVTHEHRHYNQALEVQEILNKTSL